MPGQTPSDHTVLNFLFELGQLKWIPRTGWFRAGVEQPESVADHNLRAAQLAYVLAEMEGHPEPERVCTMVVFHEIGETRVGDVDTVGTRYIEKGEARAAQDQLGDLGAMGEDLYELWDDVEHRRTQAGIIAKDADKLEAALTAREYIVTGHADAQVWIDSTREMLETESARRLIDEIDEADPTAWWRELDGR